MQKKNKKHRLGNLTPSICLKKKLAFTHAQKNIFAKRIPSLQTVRVFVPKIATEILNTFTFWGTFVLPKFHMSCLTCPGGDRQETFFNPVANLTIRSYRIINGPRLRCSENVAGPPDRNNTCTFRLEKHH